jgi:hypothetical protein
MPFAANAPVRLAVTTLRMTLSASAMVTVFLAESDQYILTCIINERWKLVFQNSSFGYILN